MKTLVLTLSLGGLLVAQEAAKVPYAATEDQACKAVNIDLNEKILQMEAEITSLKRQIVSAEKQTLRADICASANLKIDACVIDAKDGKITAHAKEAPKTR